VNPLDLLASLAYEFREVIALAVGLYLVVVTGVGALISALLIAGRTLPKL
jgi:hypothetical protein